MQEWQERLGEKIRRAETQKQCKGMEPMNFKRQITITQKLVDKFKREMLTYGHDAMTAANRTGIPVEVYMDWIERGKKALKEDNHEDRLYATLAYGVAFWRLYYLQNKLAVASKLLIEQSPTVLEEINGALRFCKETQISALPLFVDTVEHLEGLRDHMEKELEYYQQINGLKVMPDKSKAVV